jgi:hypothetical protein
MKNLRTTIVAGIALVVGCGIGASVVHMTAVRNAKASVLKQMTAVMAMEHLSQVVFGHLHYDMEFPDHKEMCRNFLPHCPHSPCN